MNTCETCRHATGPSTERTSMLWCLLIVSEVKSFGVQGYVTVPGKGDAFLRPTWAEIERVGKAAVIHA